MQLDAEYSNDLFNRVMAHDARYRRDDYLHRWLFAERLYARNQRKEMSFFEYEGPSHLIKYLRWIHQFDFTDWFLAGHEDLVEASVIRDRRVVAELGLRLGNTNLDAIGTYNAQDYLLQRFYPVPDAQRPRTILDFGAGHGRMANLALRPEDGVTELMIAVDGIAGSYLTQRAYYAGLGLAFADYVDFRAEDGAFDFAALRQTNQLLHLPTWRLDLIPDASVDLVCCVQVLKELPRQLVPFVLQAFARMVKPGGAIYIRDHVQDHHPNQMPIDALLLANGFTLEFAPQVRDRIEIHGVPRIWRRIDPALYFEAEPT